MTGILDGRAVLAALALLGLLGLLELLGFLLASLAFVAFWVLSSGAWISGTLLPLSGFGLFLIFDFPSLRFTLFS